MCFSSQQDVFDLIAGCWQVVKVSEAGAGGLRRNHILMFGWESKFEFEFVPGVLHYLREYLPPVWIDTIPCI